MASVITGEDQIKSNCFITFPRLIELHRESGRRHVEEIEARAMLKRYRAGLTSEEEIWHYSVVNATYNSVRLEPVQVCRIVYGASLLLINQQKWRF